METTDFVFRLLAAMAAGGLVGLEREWSNKSAGLKTNMLVAVGACIFVLVNVMISSQSAQSDPTRIIGQIVTGIGFLGGGVILHRGANVHGLTTAATIWCSAALGSIAGMGFFLETAICTVAVLIVNLVFRRVDDWFEERGHKKESEENKR